MTQQTQHDPRSQHGQLQGAQSDGTEALRRQIEKHLADFFAEQQSAAEAYGMEFSGLWALASEHVQGGKLVRPVLMMTIVEALLAAEIGTMSASGTSSETASGALDRATLLRLAVAIEILHYSFLLHDDVIDGDVMRRGKRNLIGALQDTQTATRDDVGSSMRALHWASTGGILMGDLLLSATHQIVARAKLPHETRLRLLDLLDHTIFETVAGELTDVGLSADIIAPDLQTVLTMSAHKTATYTFELPLRVAAILAGVSRETEGALITAGRHLGLAFQLQDDYLSTFGDPREHGKDAFSDLREGKHTAIISFARMTSAWVEIEQDFGNPDLSYESGEAMRDLLAECGAERFMCDLVEEQTAALFELFARGSAVPIPSAAREVLLGLAAELDRRRA